MSHRSLEGLRALVTGASSGIGEGIARAFAEAGARVVVNYRGDAEAADGVVADIRANGGEAMAVQADVSRPEDVAALFAAAKDTFGGLDILVANAGVQHDAMIGEMTLEQWRGALDVDLTGAFLCAQAAVQAFRAQPASGRRCKGAILFVSSVHQRIPWAGHVNYAAAKGGVKLLMESLAQEVAPERIRVNAVAPGAIRTEINRPAWETPEAMARLLTMIPYGRIGEPDDVAKAATWLCSDAADYVTGTTLYVDGGMTLYPQFAHGG